jgi:hypothetical protein
MLPSAVTGYETHAISPKSAIFLCHFDTVFKLNILFMGVSLE